MAPSSSHIPTEYYVAYFLSRAGYLTSLTLGAAKAVDLIITNSKGQSVTIDAKGLKDNTFWGFGSRPPTDERYGRPNHFFALAAYGRRFSSLKDIPELFLIPSTEASRMLEPSGGKQKAYWLSYKKIKDSTWRVEQPEDVQRIFHLDP